MLDSVGILDLLNAREQATLVWLAVVAGLAAWSRGHRCVNGRRAARLLAWKLVLLFGGAVLYTAVLVLGAEALGAAPLGPA